MIKTRTVQYTTQRPVVNMISIPYFQQTVTYAVISGKYDRNLPSCQKYQLNKVHVDFVKSCII